VTWYNTGCVKRDRVSVKSLVGLLLVFLIVVGLFVGFFGGQGKTLTSIKAVYLFSDDVTDAVLTKCVSAGVTHIYLHVGYYYNTGITPTASVDANIVTIRAKSASFIIFGYVSSTINGTLIDISTASKRTALASAVNSFMAAHNLDGFHDNMEGRTDSNLYYDASYLAWLNLMHSTVDARGKLSSASVGWRLNASTWYGALTLDCVCPMLYDSQPLSKTEIKVYTDLILSKASCPVVLACLVPTAYGYAQIASQLQWINEVISVKMYAKFAGVAVYEADVSTSYDASYWTAYTSWTATPYATSATAIYKGLSSYPRDSAGAYSTSIIDNVIEYMDNKGLNLYRMSIYYNVADATRDAMVLHYLTHCNYPLIVCRHVYNPGGSYSNSDWTDAQAWTLDLLATFSTYQNRLMVEPVNECGDSDIATHLQTLVTAVRAAGYTAPIVANKWNQSWATMASVTDSLNRFYVGYHFYFNSWSVANAQAQMQTALDAGCKIINTEVGADYNEANAFSTSEVTALNQFNDWCYSHGISNLVWMRYGLQNSQKYTELGLAYPPLSATPVEPTVAKYTLTIISDNNGYTSPNGVITNLEAGSVIGIMAVPNEDYTFIGWKLNNTNTGTLNPLYLTINRDNLLQPMYSPVPTSTSVLLTVYAVAGGETNPSAGVYARAKDEFTTVSATANYGYELTGWVVDGTTYTSTTLNLLMSANRTVKPVFTSTNPEYINPAIQGDAQIEQGNGSYSTLLNTVKAQLRNTATPSFTNAVNVLENVQPKSFAEILTALKQVKL